MCWLSGLVGQTGSLNMVAGFVSAGNCVGAVRPFFMSGRQRCAEYGANNGAKVL